MWLMLIILTVFRGFKYLLTALLSSGPRRSFKRTIAVAISRALSFTVGPLTGITAKDLPTTGDAVRQYCKEHGLDMRSVSVPISSKTRDMEIPSAQLHLVTPKEREHATTPRAKSVLLYLHGGGYRFPLPGASHMQFALRLANTAHASCLAILEYGLAPNLQHPGQLVQAIEALRYLLCDSDDGGAGYAARDVFLFGDSAGGNMVAGLLAHLRYASPYAEPVNLAGRLGAAAMLSPWVSMRHDTKSYVENAGVDTIDLDGGVESRVAWKPKKGDRFADMLCVADDASTLGTGSADVKEFWSGVFRGQERVVERALILTGGDEIIRDDVVAFGVAAGAVERVSGPKDGEDDDEEVVLVTCPGETHCGAILDVIAGIWTDKGMLAELLRWLDRGV
jgi:acetyl esterase/lipase